MASFIPTKHEANEYNNGEQYVDGGGVQPKTINNLIESALYSQDVAERAKTVSDSSLTVANDALNKVNEVLSEQVVSPTGSYPNLSVGKATNDENGNNIASQFSEIWKKIYPVGAYYISNTSTSPASLFGGAWTEITGRFLYANHGGYISPSSTGQGGSNTHWHEFSDSRAAAMIRLYGGKVYGTSSKETRGGVIINKSGYEFYAQNITSGDSIVTSFPEAGNTLYGTPLTGSTDDATLPIAYQIVYAWRRTA